VLATVCPNTLFPYIREMVDSMAVRGGFPAVQLAPVNFDAAYADAVSKQTPPAPEGSVTH
jgi:preprotein translocase subunit SecB